MQSAPSNQRKSPTFGIIAMIFGVSSVFGLAIFTSLPAIILAITALVRREEQKWLSIVAIILAVIGLLLLAILIALFGGGIWLIIYTIKEVTVP